MTDIPAESPKKQRCYYRVLLLVAGDKIAFLQREVSSVIWEGENRLLGIMLPTDTPEIGHCVPVVQTVIGNDTRVYFGPVDTLHDLSLSLGNAVIKLKAFDWVKSEPDHTLLLMRDEYFKKIFPR